MCLYEYHNPALCIVRTVKPFLHISINLRGPFTHLLISFHKSHRSVSKDAIVARWIITFMLEGIDVAILKAQSTRVASDSDAE